MRELKRRYGAYRLDSSHVSVVQAITPLLNAPRRSNWRSPCLLARTQIRMPSRTPRWSRQECCPIRPRRRGGSGETDPPQDLRDVARGPHRRAASKNGDPLRHAGEKLVDRAEVVFFKDKGSPAVSLLQSSRMPDRRPHHRREPKARMQGLPPIFPGSTVLRGSLESTNPTYATFLCTSSI